MGSTNANDKPNLTPTRYENAPQIGRRLGHATRDNLTVIGKLDLLDRHLTAFLCSRKCPGDLILKAYDWAREIRDGDRGVISGFHSSIEKDCLEILLRGRCPIIVSPARAIDRMRIPRDWREPIAAGRLLILSMFPPSVKRPTAETCNRRNHFVAELADDVLLGYAAPGGKTAALREWITGQGKKVAMLGE